MSGNLRKSFKKIPLARKSFWTVRLILKRILGVRASKLTKELESKEHVVKHPPFTKEIAKAVMEISPHYYFRATEKSREIYETDQNATCWGEYEALIPYLSKISTPNKVLEMGAGFGRSAVFFKKMLDWKDTELHLYEGEGAKGKYPMLGKKSDYSFRSNISVLRQILDFNNITNYKIIEPQTVEFKLSKLPGPYDIIYSFYAVGFHWALEHFFDDIFELMHEKTLVFLTIPDEFDEFEKLKKVNIKIIQYKAAWPANRILKILLMSKSKEIIDPS